MKSNKRSVLKWAAWLLTALLALAAAGSGYVYSVMPRPSGDKPALQTELFAKPGQPWPVSGRFIHRSAAELAALIRNRQATSTEVVQEHINHIKNENHRTNAFVWLFEQEALQAAARADAQVARGEPLGLLHGVPVSVKESFGIAGKPSTANAELLQAFRAPRHAAAVEAWLAQGAIVLGTTNVPKMLFDLQTFGEIYPRASNPYDPARTPGGSTGGGAAAVAAGLSPIELGSDMGGSIRLPAAFSGIYGLKTTEGSLDMAGAFPGVPGSARYQRMPVAGPLARTVDDLELAWTALISKWPEQRSRMLEPKAALREYRVAYLDEWAFGGDRIRVGQEVKERLAQLIGRLQAQGVAARQEQPGGFAEMVAMHRVLVAYLAFEKLPWIVRQLMALDFKRGDDHRFDLTEFFERLADLDERKYDDILKRRAVLTQRLEDFFARHDVLIMPVAAGPAIEHNEQHLPIDLDGERVGYWHYFVYPIVFNATGHPALTVPLGLDRQGLPLAVQLVGPLHSERRLLAFARLIAPLHPGYVKPPAR